MIDVESNELNFVKAAYLNAARRLACEALRQRMELGIMDALESIERGEPKEAEEHLMFAMMKVDEVYEFWDNGESLEFFSSNFSCVAKDHIDYLPRRWDLWKDRFELQQIRDEDPVPF